MHFDSSTAALAFQAQAGDAGAQFRLGVQFLLGDPGEQDLVAAYRWLALAASNCHSGAQRLLVHLEYFRPAPSSESLWHRIRRVLSVRASWLSGHLVGRRRKDSAFNAVVGAV
jgi:TPR repeat protein